MPSRADRLRRKDPAYKPKPSNAFICFRSEFSKNSKAEKEGIHKQQGMSLSEAANKMKQSDVSRNAGEVWHSMSVEERIPYKQKALELKRLHDLKYPELCGKGRSAGKKTAKNLEVAPQASNGRGRKGRKPRAPDNSAAILDIPSVSSPLHTGHGVLVSLPHPVVPSQGPFFPSHNAPSAVPASSYAVPVPMPVHPFHHENGWSSSSMPSDEFLLHTLALTPSYTLSLSPAPSLYTFSPSAASSRVPSPAVLDFASDGTFYPDLSQAPMLQFAAPREGLPLPEYQLYNHHSSFNGCGPLVPDHVAYSAPPAVYGVTFPNELATQMIPIPHSLSLGMELETAQAGYTWSGELVDQAPLISAVDVAAMQAVQQLALKRPVSLGTSTARPLDWWIAELTPVASFNEPVGSSDW
ncbi:hypothetical protein LXA43DRAFT_147478 [Ganoderma leucocontextum]|nr:hypothetical protein LXA43DRAFT_147478 [Ganoderma leucocontextum]